MEDKLKINFFKKLWYSIARPSKYEKLRNLGIGKAIQYFFSLISILAIVLAIIAAFLQIKVVNNAIAYLDEKIPEFTFKENKLTLENADATILDDEKIISYLGNKIVINSLIKKEDAINQYKDLATENNKVLIFLNEEYVLISNKYNPESENNEGIENKKYSEVSSKFITDTSYEYSKKDLIEYLKERTTYTYYIAQFFVIYFGFTTFRYFIYIVLIAASLWLVTKLSKSKWTLGEAIMNTIYASTLSMVVYVLYLIISYFTGLIIPIVDIISIFFIFTYLYLLVWKRKKREKI